MARFFDAPDSQLRRTPTNGTFCLRDLALFTARHLGRPIVIESRAIGGWLSVPYVSRDPPDNIETCTLERVVAPIISAFADSPTAMEACG
jgi:hypothetical protein